MARTFLTPIDLSGLELLNARIQNLPSPPDHSPGRVYFDTSIGLLRLSDGTDWTNLDPQMDTDAVRALIVSTVLGSSSIARTVGTGSSSVTFSVAENGITSAELANEAVTNASVASNAAITLDKIAETSTQKIFTSAERSKLSGISAGATVNSTDSALRDRSTHTGTQSRSTISDFDAGVRANRLDQLAAPNSAVSMGGQRLTNVATPTGANDAVNKSYVDSVAEGLTVLDPVRVLIDTNVNTSGAASSYDGVTLANGDRVLLTSQATASQNGIYVVASSGNLNKETGEGDRPGSFVFILEGTKYGDSGWVNGADLESAPQDWKQFSRTEEVGAGNGLTRTGNVLSVNGSTGISVGAGGVSIDASVVSRKYSANLTGSATQTVAHGLNTRDVVVKIYETASPYSEVEVDVEHTSASQVTIRFASAPAAGAYRAVIHG